MASRSSVYLSGVATLLLCVSSLGISSEALAKPGNGKAHGWYKRNTEPTQTTDPVTTTTSTPPPPNSAPAISGQPPGSVLESEFYDFAPSASDPDGDALTFSITNQPGWADFDPQSGALYGTPTAADVGLYSDILISVTDGQATSQLSAFSIDVTAIALGSTTLEWQAPTENTDGTPLTDLSGYRIYYGTDSNQLSNVIELENPGLTTYVVDQLSASVWYFSMTALNSRGLESDPSAQLMRDMR